MGGQQNVVTQSAVAQESCGTLEPPAASELAQKLLFPECHLHSLSASNGYLLPVLGNSPAILNLLETLLHIASTDASILLRGETGAGKGFIANLVHRCSSRVQRPFVEVVCGVLAESLMESELFGHERGAFTGAVEARPGRFELAENGTIFLDEIGDLTLPMQVKLLRVLQDRKFERVGGTKTLVTGARVIAATNKDLKVLVERGEFREDLYYRLNVVSIDVPSLKQRRADIPELVMSFLSEFGMRHHGRIPTISSDAIALLVGYSWPGNVRDLRNRVERMVVLDRRGTIGAEDLPLELRIPAPLQHSRKAAAAPEAEREALLYALLKSDGNRTDAAKFFGKCRRQFHRLLRKHNLA